MPSIFDVSIEHLKQAISIRERIDALQGEHDAIMHGGAVKARRGRPRKTPEVVVDATKARKKDGRRGKRSAATRAKMAAAQKARWANVKG